MRRLRLSASALAPRASRLLSRLLAAERRGAVLPLFAVSLLVMLSAVGMSVDYAKAMRLQSKLRVAADAAAIAAVSKQLTSLPEQRGLTREESVEYSRQAAVKIFSETARQLTATGAIELDLADPAQFSVDITENADANSRTAVVRFRGLSPNAFAKILHVRTLTLKGNATSTVSAGLYTDMYVVLDTSQSMGLAATDADARKLWDATVAYNKKGCQFGCHVAAPGEKHANEWVAKQVSAKMRIDVLREATVDMVQTAMEQQNDNNLYRFGLYRIGQTTSDISPLTSDLGKISLDAQAITLGPNDSSGVGDTHLQHALETMKSKIVSKGNGSTRDKSRAFLFIVTDGVYDIYGSCLWSHCTGPIDPTLCQTYKNDGVTVAIVYTTYREVRSNPFNPGSKLTDEYDRLVKPFAGQIEPKLRQCASEGWFFEASDGPTIHAAMQRLFAQALQTPILTR